jgi:proline iminopeptidase
MKALKIIAKILIGIAIGIGVLFGLFYLLTIGEYKVPKTVAQDPSIPHVTIDGVTYHAETFGDPENPVVITIHGGPGGDYRSLLSLKALSDQHFVVYYDQRGTGLSPRVDPEEITLASSIADLDSIVEYYGKGGTVNLVGHSWGAMLASAYLGQFPEKVDRAVLAEPGFLTSESAAAWVEETKLSVSLGLLYHLLKTKFEALHVREPDEHASEDYFAHHFNMYQGDDHPQAGYRCEGSGPGEEESWRHGAAAAANIQKGAMDSDGNFDIDLTLGLEKYTNQVLFMAGECQKIIGPDWQERQMAFFPNSRLAVIPQAGHEMFLENPQASVLAVREYLNTPAE